ncbi:hypothetical protein HF086_002608, partial [Spodoptera exigua]
FCVFCVSNLFILGATTRLKMPILKIFTNLPKSKIPADFVNKILPVLSRTVKKPEHLPIMSEINLDDSFFSCSSTSGSFISADVNWGNKPILDDGGVCLGWFVINLQTVSFLMSFYDKRGRDIAKGGVTRFPAT